MAAARKICNLFETEAKERAEKVDHGVEYHIFLWLEKGESYEGYSHINFKTKPGNASGLFLDFCGDTVQSLLVNGEEVAVDEQVVRNGRIYLPDAHIRQEGHNLVEVRFSNRYFTDGNGLHTYTDVDGSQYLYIQSEPFWNNRVLPLFDQPDIKAHFSLTALIPKQWLLITSEDPIFEASWDSYAQPFNGIFHNKYFQLFKAQSVQADRKVVVYKRTQLLPTYLFSFCCGPYSFFELEEEKRFKNIPMRIYCRETMRDFIKLQTKEFFEHHAVGIQYYEQIFGLDYMFSKCDMIICPEFTIGAMEYPGAITYSEALFARGKPSIREVTTAGRVGLHELSHMWFGDCVTSYWWNDTWLKESFADFVSYLASFANANVFSFKVENSWINFLQRKLWGYEEDSKSTTHPIAAQIRSTEEADGVFDGISYSKGAATLKQLVYVVGFDNWVLAMKEYFKRKAWKNARLDDLIEVYQETLGGEQGTHLDMNQWKRDWLETPGTNIIAASWNYESNVVKFNQSAVLQQHPKLRFHKILVSFFGEDGQVIDSQPVLVGNTEVTEFVVEDISKVKAILPNDQDHDFVKVSLDYNSTQYFKIHINQISDELTQACIYKNFYDMVLDGKLPATEFVEFVMSSYDSHYSVTLSNMILSLFRTVANCYLTHEVFLEYAQKLCNIAYKNFKKHMFNDFFGSQNFCLMLDFGFDFATIDRLKAIYDACRVNLISGELNINNKWLIVKRIYTCLHYPAEERQRYFDELWQADHSDTKTIYKAQIDVILSTPEQLEQVFAETTKNPLDFSFKVLQYKLMAINDYYLPEATRAHLIRKYYSIFDELTSNRSRSIAKSFINGLLPKVDDLAEVHKILKEAIGRLDPSVKFGKKVMTQRLEDIEEIMRARLCS